jgi:hypothetical protein
MFSASHDSGLKVVYNVSGEGRENTRDIMLDRLIFCQNSAVGASLQDVSTPYN